MFRIGFDPLFEAAQQHREQIKQAELYRLAQETMSGTRARGRSSARILAFIGKGLAAFGSSLASRYGDQIGAQVSLDSQSNPEGCI